jgi:hypothetical protein
MSERSQNVSGSGAKPSCKEALAVMNQVRLRGVLGFQNRCEIIAGIGVLGRKQRVNVLPFLRPHVAEKVGRNGPVGRHQIAVFLPQFGPDIGV